MGLDIAACKAASGSWQSATRIIGDLTEVAPLLHDVHFRCHLFALNPPWGLEWDRGRLEHLAGSDLPAVANASSAINGSTIDSTIATMMLALHHMTELGEGFLIANASTTERLIFSADAPASSLAKHVWARVRLAGNPMTSTQGNAWEDSMAVDVIWFARSHQCGPSYTYSAANPEEWRTASRYLAKHRSRYRSGIDISNWHVGKGLAGWTAVAEEWRQSRKPARTDWNVWLTESGTIETYVSLFDEVAVSRRLARDASDLHAIARGTPMQLVTMRSMRKTLLRACSPESPWRVAPAVIAAVAEAVQSYNAGRAPLYPLPKVQRLGYLDEEDFIECRVDLHHPRLAECVGARLMGGAPVDTKLAKPLFKAGQRYPLATWTTTVTRRGSRMNVQGAEESLEFTGQELVICITSGEFKIAFVDPRALADGTDLKGLQGKKRVDVCAPLQLLLDHFEIPEISDVTTVHPERFRTNVHILSDLKTLLWL
jgi:hypothetical protein